MGRVLPDTYPADGELDEDYLQLEHKLGRVLDYAVIQPRLRPLYDWSARQLGRPELSGLLIDGIPAYEWPAHIDTRGSRHDFRWPREAQDTHRSPLEPLVSVYLFANITRRERVETLRQVKPSCASRNSSFPWVARS